MRNILLILCALSISGPSVAAYASTMDTFTFVDQANTYTFTLPGSPTAANLPPGEVLGTASYSYSFGTVNGFDITNVAVSENGGSSVATTVDFYNSAVIGSRSICVGVICSYGITSAGSTDLFFSGTDAAPTFLAESNVDLLNQQNKSGSLTISLGQTVTPAATPEPSSFVLLGTGVLGLAGAARRRFLKA